VRSDDEVVAALAVSSGSASLDELLASHDRAKLAAEELSARLAVEPA
jgi:hypothetical protein